MCVPVLSALLMCGGKGKRMKLPFRGVKEKPLLEVYGRKLVDHSIRELDRTGIEFVALTSEYTPETECYLRDMNVNVVRAPGFGYIQDIVWFVRKKRLSFPLLVISADIVFFRSVLDDVMEFYVSGNSVALSCVDEEGKNVGINVLDGYYTMFYPNRIQPEVEMTVEGVMNVNTREDVRLAEIRFAGLRV